MRHDDLCAVLHDDPEEAARSAGLRYVSDEEAGYRRLRCGRGFTYRDWEDRTVRDRRLRKRFDELVIPPAWRDVWICRFRKGHLQAVGRDEAGRKQYLYHPLWREMRERCKYDRLAPFGRLLPRIRARVESDLQTEGLSRQRVLAAVVRLLDLTAARVGNDDYAETNGSYGLTTLRKRHVDLQGNRAILTFDGKSGREWTLQIEDPAVVDVITRCLDTPGWRLFKFLDETGVKREVDAEAVNAYLGECADAAVTAKDFRTWAGTVLAARSLLDLESEADVENPPLRAVERVAEALRNTPAVCRESYIHPAILDREDGDPLRQILAKTSRRAVPKHLRGLERDEVAVLRALEEVGSLEPRPS